ncbi:MAG: PAS domain-containing sensor histidine kinase [Anaerolineae bacterium]|nr:PAS domain-containing sensor histidine kinase [Anaerolineae bacterium]
MLSDQSLDKLAHEAARRNCTVDDLVERLLSDKSGIERALRESEERYRGIVESQIDLVCRYTTEPRLTFVNDAYCAYFRKTREELIGQSYIPLIDEDQHEAVFRRLRDCQQDPRPRVAEVRSTSPNGDVRWIEWVDFGITDDSGKVVMVQAVGREITRVKQIEDALRANEHHYRVLFEYGPLPKWVYDTETLKILDVNRAAVAEYGFSREEFLHMDIRDLVAPEHLAEMQARMTQPNYHIEGDLESQHVRKDGTCFDVEIRSHEISLGKHRARLVVAHDLTLRKQLEQERIYTSSLETALAKDREILQLKESFLSIISHELRTPLTVIMSGVNILSRYHDKLTFEMQQDRLERIRMQVERMSHLIDDVLAVSRGQADQIEFRPALTLVQDLCNEIAEYARIVDQNRHPIHVDFTLLPGSSAMLDKRLIEHILINLLTNATKYSDNGKPVNLGVSQNKGELVFTVRDSGIGIPEQEQERLFQPFFRANNVTSIDGTGLGLVIVKQSVERHGGTIDFESHLNQGTSFTIRLPAIDPEAVHPAAH